MKSDIIHVTSKGDGTQEALAQADASALFKGLDKKQAMHLRLLTEEMMSLVTELTGEKEADFWIETDKKGFQLHLNTVTIMNSEKRVQLLATSTSGKNSAAKGILGKLRDLLERSLEPVDGVPMDYYPAGWTYNSLETSTMMTTPADIWSFNQYRESISKEKSEEEWDELEKSIIANLADEVTISISGDTVEMTVYKSIK